jgi:hypothetical protein
MPRDFTKLHLRNPKTLGISFSVWKEYVHDFFTSMKIEIELDNTTLADLHRKDASAQEAYYFQRLSSIHEGSGKVTLAWTDENGDCQVELISNEQIRRFYDITDNMLKKNMVSTSKLKYGMQE